MKLLYVAGPLRSKDGAWGVHRNLEAARAIARQLWMMGYAVICPHANSAHMDGPWTETNCAGVPCGPVDHIFINGDLEMVRRCDLLVMMPNWQTSEGATIEQKHALSQGIPVYQWPEDAVLLRDLV
jgi:hypothetical protein